jgi:hypothetical protein
LPPKIFFSGLDSWEQSFNSLYKKPVRGKFNVELSRKRNEKEKSDFEEFQPKKYESPRMTKSREEAEQTRKNINYLKQTEKITDNSEEQKRTKSNRFNLSSKDWGTSWQYDQVDTFRPAESEKNAGNFRIYENGN